MTENKEISLEQFNIWFNNRKKIIFFFTAVAFIASTVISLLIPVWYKSSAVLIPSKQDSFGLNSLSGVVKDFIPLKGGSSKQTDHFLSLLYSETLLWDVIQEFNLVKEYDIKEYPRMTTIKMLRSNVNFDATEDGNLLIEVWDTDSIQTQKMALYIIDKLNELNNKLAIEEANNNLKYLEVRYNQILIDVKISEENMKKYQQKYGVFDISTQGKSMISAMAELSTVETSLELQKINLADLGGYQTNQINNQINFIQKKMKELEVGKNSSSYNLLPPIKNLPDLGTEYYRLYRDLEIKNKIIVFITPLLEQARLEQSKNIPSVIILDPPLVPERKDRPKRSLIILAATLSVFSISFLILLIWDLRDKNHRLLFGKKN